MIDLACGLSAEDLAVDRDRRDALLWNFTVLGEAIAQLSDTTRSEHGDVRWSDPVRLRNRIVHGYWSVDLDVALATARDDVPAFLAAVRAVAASITEAVDDA